MMGWETRAKISIEMSNQSGDQNLPRFLKGFFGEV